MGAVWLRFRAEARSRWHAWLGLVLLAGLAAGAVMALAAGARRTDSAYRRFVRVHRGFDALVINYPEDNTAVFDFDQIARLPQVEASARAVYGYTNFNVPFIADPENRLGTRLNRFKILAGRAAHPRRADEAVVPFVVAEQFHLRVGSRIQLVDNPDDAALEDEQVQALLDALPDGKLRVVGIEASPGEFPPQRKGGSPLHLSAAFARLLGEPDHEALVVRLRRGAQDYPAFERELRARSQNKPLQILNAEQLNANVERAIHTQSVALWILAGLVALTASLVLGQLFARLSILEAADLPMLAALGMTRGDRTAIGVLRAGALGTAAAFLGVIVATVASPVFPTGLARTAEPDPGLRFDGLVLGAGCAVALAAVVLVALGPAWLAARVTRSSAAASATRTPSRVARAATGAGLPAPAVTGLRMALEPGRGATAVPVRTSVAAIVIGVVTLVAALGFAASLDHLLDTPRLTGVTWDLTLTNFGYGAPVSSIGAAAARGVPGIAAFGLGDVGAPYPLRVNTVSADMVAVEDVVGHVVPPVVEGRLPRRANEVALGPRTFDASGARVGGTVRVAFPDQARQTLRVVGKAILPPASDTTRSGTGVLVTLAGERRLLSGFEGFGTTTPGVASRVASTLFVRLRPTADPHAVIAALNRQVAVLCDERPGDCPPPIGAGTLSQMDVAQPADVVNFGRVQNTPFILSGVVAVLALGTLAHVLATAQRRRRRDLAILKTIGFTRGQVRSTVAIHATATTCISLVIGLPLGLAVGRWLWHLRADDLGILDEPRTPWLALAATVAAAVVVANLVAALPARAAARTSPVVVLRSE